MEVTSRSFPPLPIISLENIVRTATMLLLVVSAAAAEDHGWQIGGAGGYGFYHNGSVFSSNGQAETGVRDRFAFGFFLDQDLYQHLGGEIRYTYQDGDFFLSAGGRRADIQSHSHTIHYDLLLEPARRASAIRPYLAVGGGAKQYVTNSAPSGDPTLRNIAVFRQTSEFKPVLSVGGGVKARMGRYVVVRFDFRDYMTAFPDKIVRPAGGGVRGLLHQFTPMVGIGFAF
jgi:hypothetical protein